MSLYLISFISALAFFILLLAFILIRSIISPKKTATIEKYINAGKYTAAIKRAKAIIAKNPRDTKAHYLLGKAYLADGKAELALMEFKSISNATFESKAQEKEFRNLTAQLYERFQQHTEALAEYALLIKLDPQNSLIRRNKPSIIIGKRSVLIRNMRRLTQRLASCSFAVKC